MSALEFVAFAVAIFFVIGVGVGVIAVTALAATRKERAARRPAPARREHAGGADREIGHAAITESAGNRGVGGDGTGPQWPDTGYRS